MYGFDIIELAISHRQQLILNESAGNIYKGFCDAHLRRVRDVNLLWLCVPIFCFIWLDLLSARKFQQCVFFFLPIFIVWFRYKSTMAPSTRRAFVYAIRSQYKKMAGARRKNISSRPHRPHVQHRPTSPTIREAHAGGGKFCREMKNKKEYRYI